MRKHYRQTTIHLHKRRGSEISELRRYLLHFIKQSERPDNLLTTPATARRMAN